MNTIYKVRSRIDNITSKEFDKEVREAYPDGFPEGFTLDASELEYISSAGLRVLLRLKKEIGRLHMINVCSDVYEVLEMCGFSQISDAEKAMRQITIEGCPEIGSGAHGVVYRIAPDTIV